MKNSKKVIEGGSVVTFCHWFSLQKSSHSTPVNNLFSLVPKWNFRSVFIPYILYIDIYTYISKLDLWLNPYISTLRLLASPHVVVLLKESAASGMARQGFVHTKKPIYLLWSLSDLLMVSCHAFGSVKNFNINSL